jgi:hypothetical protein
MRLSKWIPSAMVALGAAFLSANAQAQDQQLFTNQTPALLDSSDGAGVNYELGMKFSSTAAGVIKGIRFYKSSRESGTHVGKIFSSSGKLLAKVTFTGETASGWQQQMLATPLSIAANTKYTVSVNTGNTYYVDTISGLASQVSNGNLRSVVGNNGVFGPVGKFPTKSWSNSNYFRDVVFALPAAPAPAPVTTTTTASPEWQNLAFASQIGQFTAQFDAVPSLSDEDVVIGLSKSAASAYTDLAALIRFGNNGLIDVRNGSQYAALASMSNVAGATYHVRMVVDVAAKKYSVYVTRQGQSEVMLAQDYSFRDSQSTVTSLANLAKYNEVGDVAISNFSMTTAASTSAPAPAPAPAQTSAPAPAPAPTPTNLAHGKDLTLSMVGPAAIGITSFVNGGSGGSIYDAGSASYIKQINSSATYDGFTVSGAHLLIQGVSISGSLDIYSSLPVVIRGSSIHGTGWWGIYARAGAAPIYVLYSDIGGISASADGPTAVSTSNAGHNVMFRNHVTYAGDGFGIGSQNDQILENYVEKFSPYGGAHNDGVQSGGNNNGLVIARNKILLNSSETGCVNLGTWGGTTAQYVTVDSNYFAGGSYTFYGGAGGAGVSNHIVVNNNVFGYDFYSTVGYYGAVAYWESGTGNTWSNNVTTSGAVVNP